MPWETNPSSSQKQRPGRVNNVVEKEFDTQFPASEKPVDELLMPCTTPHQAFEGGSQGAERRRIDASYNFQQRQCL